MKVSSAEDVVRSIRSGMRVFVHGAAATPAGLLDALVGRASELRDVEPGGDAMCCASAQESEARCC